MLPATKCKGKETYEEILWTWHIYKKSFSFLILQINIWHSVDSDATDNLFTLNIYWLTRKAVGEELGKVKMSGILNLYYVLVFSLTFCYGMFYVQIPGGKWFA